MSTQATLEGDIIDIELEAASLSTVQRAVLRRLLRDSPHGRYLLDLERALRLPPELIARELEHLVGAAYVRIKIRSRGPCYYASPFKYYLFPFLDAEMRD
ncbi:MAG: hypothetical protein ACXVI0_09420 [Halobacteriota archaeon]